MVNPQRSLVGRLVLSFLLPSLAILLLVVTIGYSRASAALRESFFGRLGAVATAKQAALDAWIDHLYRQTLLLAEVPGMAEQAAALEPGRPPEESAEARRQILRLFESALENRPSLTELALLAPADGRVLVSTEPQNVGSYRLYDRYYQEGRLAPFIQKVQPSPVTLKPTLTISAPVRDAEGGLLTVLAAHLSLEYLDASVLQRTGLGKSGAVTLVDRHKVVVSGQHYGELEVSRLLTSEAIEKVVAGESGSGIYSNLAGTRVLGVYRWLPQPELGLLVEVAQREAQAPARRLAVSILVAGAVLVSVLVLGFYLMAVRTAGPILQLTRAAQRVTRGELDSRASVGTDDEIGALASAFNAMVEQLESHYGEMSEKIQQLERAERALRDSLEELRLKNEELETFNYTVSHDLKTPLVTIQGFLGFIQEDLDAGQVKEASADLDRVSKAADRMVELLDDLLTLSRIGRHEANPEACHFEQLARQAIDSVAGRERPPGTEIVVDSPLPVVHVQRASIVQVLENLIANALKHAGAQDALRVEIGMRHSEEGPVFYVRDNGVGIEPAYHDKVFGLFERLDSGATGTGVGLAIVRRIIEHHGGRVWVDAAGPAGATFCFTLAEPRSDRPGS